MASVLYRLRAELRHGWRALRGHRRARRAVRRGRPRRAWPPLGAPTPPSPACARRPRPGTSIVNPNNGGASKLTMAELRKLPGVERIGGSDGVILYPSLVKSVPDAFSLPPMIVPDTDATYTVGRPLMVAGHQPAADDPDGVWVDRTFARSRHLHVGQTVPPTSLITPDLLQRLQEPPSEAEAHAILNADAPASMQGDARIDGIGMTQDGVVVDPGYDPAVASCSPRRSEPPTRTCRVPYWGAMVKLKPGTDVDAFTARVQALVPARVDRLPAGVGGDGRGGQRHRSRGHRPWRPSPCWPPCSAWWWWPRPSPAACRSTPDRNATLATMGTTRPQRAAVSMTKALRGGGHRRGAGRRPWRWPRRRWARSAPSGRPRCTRGSAVDWPLLGARRPGHHGGRRPLTAIPAWRSVAGRVTSARGDDPVAGGGARWPPPAARLAAVVGVRFGLERGAGRTSVPVRTTLLAAATAVALVTSVVVFSGSLDQLLGNPRLYGIGLGRPDPARQPQHAGRATTTRIRSRLAASRRQFVDVADRSGSVAASSLLDVGEVRSGALAIPAIGTWPSRPGGAARPSPRAGAGARPTRWRSARRRWTGSTPTSAAPSSWPIGEQGPDRAGAGWWAAPSCPAWRPYPGSDKAGLGVGALLTQAGWQQFSPDYQKTEYLFRWAPGAVG